MDTLNAVLHAHPYLLDWYEKSNMNTKGCIAAEMFMKAFKIINAPIQIVK